MSELPYGRWTTEYKQFLCQLVTEGSVKSFQEHHKTDAVHFEIVPSAVWLDEKAFAAASASKLPPDVVAKLKLRSTLSTANMCAFAADGGLRRFDSPEGILDEHFRARLAGYVTRRAGALRSLAREEKIARARGRFVAQIVAGTLELFRFGTGAGAGGVDERALVDRLRTDGYPTMREIRAGAEANAAEVATDTETPSPSGSGSGSSDEYGYLLELPLHSLTVARVTALQRDADLAAARLLALQRSTPADLWLADLGALQAGLTRHGAERSAVNVSAD